jgi:hypothetical protein
MRGRREPPAGARRSVAQRRIAAACRRLCLLALAISTAWAAESLRTARAPDYQAESRFGRFDLRIRMSGTVDLTLSGTQAAAELYTGATLEPVAILYTQPVPRTPLRSTRAALAGSSGKVKVALTEPPRPSNGYTAKIRVAAGKPVDAYVRLIWEAEPGSARRRLGSELRSSASRPAQYDNAVDGYWELRGVFANDAEIRVRGDRVFADGPFVLEDFRFSQPLPAQPLPKLALKGKAKLIQSPSKENQFTATLRVSNPKPEGEALVLRIEWRR